MENIPLDKFEKMVSEAKAAGLKAYCPYSKFKVGAVLETEDGDFFSGCNVENASYGLTICAERNSLFQMIAKGKKAFLILVIYTPTPKPSAPCGACRQVLNEFSPNAIVISVCDSDMILQTTVSNLLPEAFGSQNFINLEIP